MQRIGRVIYSVNNAQSEFQASDIIRRDVMRAHQMFGHNGYLSKLLYEFVGTAKETGVTTYPDGRVEPFEREVTYSTVKIEDYAEHTPWYDEIVTLHKYTFPNGKVYFDYVQAEPWSSGPCTFLALKDESGIAIKESLWSQAEIDNA